MTTPTNCPHCGAEYQFHADGLDYFACLTIGSVQSDMCKERVARQKAEAELQEARRFDIRNHVPTTYGDAQAAGWITRDDCAGHEWDNRTSVENLAWTIQRASETRKALEEEREANAWKITPAMAEEKIRQLNADLSETLRKLAEAACLISKLMPYLRHKGPKCCVVCECGLNEIIMEAGKRAGVVKTAEAEKGGAS